MTDRTKQFFKLSLRVTVTLLLLGWVVSKVDMDQFRETAKTARWQYLIGIWAATAVFFGVQSVAMRMILRRQDCNVSLGTLFGASCITTLYSLVLPGILSTGVKWFILKRHTGKGSHVLSSMLYNQVMLTGVMAGIGLVGLTVTNPTSILFPEAQRRWVLPVVCGLVLVLMVGTVGLLLNGRAGPAGRLFSVLLKPLPHRLQEKGRAVLTQLAVFQTAGWRFHLAIAGLNVLDGLFVGLLIYLSAAQAAGVDVPVGVLVWLATIVFVLGKIPVSIANLGVREVVLVTLLRGYGVTESSALLMSVTLFSALLFMASLGAFFQLLWAIRARRTLRSADSGSSLE